MGRTSEAYKACDPIPADLATVGRFVGIISAQAMRACEEDLDSAGLLQLTRIHPADGKLASIRFLLDDVEGMAKTAAHDAGIGFNVYMEGRTVRADTRGTRGKKGDTAAVFALVIDSDADTGKAASKTTPTPSLVVETSPGNRHLWFFLKHAASGKAGADLGAAMRAAAGADHDTGTITQPYRVAGTGNYPNRKKQARGRHDVHITKILSHSGALYTAEELLAAFPKPEPEQRSGSGSDAADDSIDWRDAEQALPTELRDLIRNGVEEGRRSEQFHHAVGWLKRLHWSERNTLSLLSAYPNGIAAKYARTERLEEEVRRSFEKCDAPPPQGNADYLEEMNRAYAVVKVSGKTRVVEFEESPTFPYCKVPVFSTIADFCAFHNRTKIKVPAMGDVREIGLGRWWIDHPERKQYSGIVYAPDTGKENGRLNLWTGFACKPVPGNCDLYLAHLRENICAGNEEHYQYLLNWKAAGVQHPGRAGEVAIVMRGKEGVGKGVAAKEYGKLYGAHYRHVVHAKHLTGHFNAHLQQCSVLYADESFFAGDRAHESILKALITEETLLIEPKGLDPFPVRNCIHLIMSSNSDWVIPASADARRYFVLNVADTHRQDHAYFGRIVDQMNNGGREALLHLLLNRDLAGFNVRLVPETEGLAQQKQHSRRGIDRLVETILCDGVLPAQRPGFPNQALTHGEDRGEGFYVAARKLVPDLKHDSSKVISAKLRDDWGCRFWHSTGLRVVTFPELSDLRERFEKRHGKQTWPTDENGNQITEWAAIHGSDWTGA